MAVIQARLTAALREADPTRRARRTPGRSVTLRPSKTQTVEARGSLWCLGRHFFGAMVEAIGDGAIYLLPALRAACREGELLLEAGRYTDALPIFDEVDQRGEPLFRVGCRLRPACRRE